MASTTRLCVMLGLPTSYALPGLRFCRESPPSIHAVPLDTGSQPFRACKAPETARRNSPGRSAEVRHPRVVTCRCLLLTPGFAEAARCGPAALRLERLLTPAVVREARAVVRMPVWGRRPGTRMRGGWGHIDTPSSSDGTMPFRKAAQEVIGMYLYYKKYYRSINYLQRALSPSISRRFLCDRYAR
jgi:hypothetical protein